MKYKYEVRWKHCGVRCMTLAPTKNKADKVVRILSTINAKEVKVKKVAEE